MRSVLAKASYSTTALMCLCCQSAREQPFIWAPVAQSVSVRHLQGIIPQSGAEVVTSSLTWSRVVLNTVGTQTRRLTEAELWYYSSFAQLCRSLQTKPATLRQYNTNLFKIQAWSSWSYVLDDWTDAWVSANLCWWDVFCHMDIITSAELEAPHF